MRNGFPESHCGAVCRAFRAHHDRRRHALCTPPARSVVTSRVPDACSSPATQSCCDRFHHALSQRSYSTSDAYCTALSGTRSPPAGRPDPTRVALQPRDQRGPSAL